MVDSRVERIFDPDQARNGGVVRRDMSFFESTGLWDEFVLEVKRRGFHQLLWVSRQLCIANQDHLS